MFGGSARAVRDGSKLATRRLSARCASWRKGDTIYVRETWAPMCSNADVMCQCCRDDGDACHYTEYRADDPDARRPGGWDDADEPSGAPAWRSARLMPRERARTYVVLTADARREPLQAITIAGAMEEGVRASMDSAWCTGRVECRCPRCSFRAIWDAINGEGSWASNPEVTVLEFCRVRSPAREKAVTR
jgi:hypothetical protein